MEGKEVLPFITFSKTTKAILTKLPEDKPTNTSYNVKLGKSTPTSYIIVTLKNTKTQYRKKYELYCVKSG